MKEKQTENIINERCEILGKLVEKIGNLKYNGAMVQTSEDFYIPASVWENRFNDNPSEHVDSIIWRALEQAVSEDATFKENEDHGKFLSKHCEEPMGHGDLFVYLSLLFSFFSSNRCLTISGTFTTSFVGK